MKTNSQMNMTPAAIIAAAKGDLHNAMTAATPGGIEAQEKAGQALLVASTNMPKEMRPSREAFEKVGFTLGNDVDELFLSAKLPAGWTRAATDHSMHSEILDEQGRKRVGIFYKAAFYDRRATSGLNCRFRVEWLFDSKDLKGGETAYIVTDCGKEIFRTDIFKMHDWSADEAHKKIAQDWLAERFQNADDPTANW